MANYLICTTCGGYYRLKKGETPEDFESCSCGGILQYIEADIVTYLVCDDCQSYYQLEEKESLNFDRCNCGGKLHYEEHIHELDKKNTKIPEDQVDPQFWNRNSIGLGMVIGGVFIFLLVYILVFPGSFSAPNSDTIAAKTYINETNQVAADMQSIVNDINIISQGLSNGTLSDKDALNRFTMDKEKSSQLVDRLTKMNVPPQYKHHHELVLQANTNMYDAIDKLIYGLQNHDKSKIQEANDLIKKSLNNMKQAKEELKNIK